MGPLSVDTWSTLEGHIYFCNETHRRIFNPKQYTHNALGFLLFNAFVYARILFLCIVVLITSSPITSMRSGDISPTI